MVSEYLPLINLGATGAMLVMVWKLMVAKDKKSYAAAAKHTEDIKAILNSTRELVVEVTTALVSKNHTDEKMALAVDKLAEQLRQLKDAVKGKSQ